MGGRVAEELIFGAASSGAASDIQKAAILAEHLVWDLGLSELGPNRYRDRQLSETMRQKLEACVDAMLQRAYDNALRVIEDRRPDLERLASALLEHEVLYEPEVLHLLGSGQQDKAA